MEKQKVRIQKILSTGGYCSRREAEKIILDKRLKVNNKLVSLGDKALYSDKFLVDNKEIKLTFKKYYYLLNKPKGYICSNVDSKNKRVIDLIKNNTHLFTIGRLDVNTTGLIIVTNDGEFSQMLEMPKNKIPKTYIAKVNKIVSFSLLEKLRTGVVLENGYKTLPLNYAEVLKKDKKNIESVVKLVLIEGKKNQIKEMFKTLGMEVINLTRIKIGNLKLHDAKLGEYRKLENFEIDDLKKIANKKTK